MLNNAVGFSEIYIVCGRTDLRYGIDSLAGVLRSLGIENLATAGMLYLFYVNAPQCDMPTVERLLLIWKVVF